MSLLLSELSLRGVEFPNRIGVSPMCQYSSVDGFADDWHFAHLSARAVGGAGLVMTEAAAVTAEGRISPQDLGVWTEKHCEPLERIARFVNSQGAVAGIQLAHAGRKGGVFRPWSGEGAAPASQGGWTPVGPSALAFSSTYPTPTELDIAGLAAIERAFAAATARAYTAGFRVVELHAAHGYLLHQFLSPLSNKRDDMFGGVFDNRVRFPLACVAAARAALPDRCPLFVRVSGTDWTEGGWDIEQTVEFARRLKALGVDLIDCSTGGNVEKAKIPVGPGYQVPFAARIRREAGIPTAAVGMITGAEQAEQILQNGAADMVLLAREFLRDPYWPLHAAQTLGHAMSWPVQYLRASPRGAPERAPWIDGE